MGAGAKPAGECDPALVRAFELLGKRWNGLILAVLRGGPRKFSDLRRAVGPITDSMLADRLLELTEGRVVERVEVGRPPQITYGLTEGGRDLLPVLEQLGCWAAAHLDCGPDLRQPPAAREGTPAALR